MMRSVICILLLASGLMAEERVYVVQALGETLGMIDLETGAVDPNVEPLDALCNEIELYDSKLFITASQHLQVIRATTNETLASIALPGCEGTWAVAHLSADSVAVSCSLSDVVYVIRISSEEIVDTVEVGNAPQGLLVHGERLFVSLTNLNFPDYGPGAVRVYDRRTLLLRDSMETSINPQFMAVDNFNRLHVVCTGDYGDIAGQIDLFNMNTLNQVGAVMIGGTPATVVFNGTYGYVAAGGWGDHGFVYRYRLQDLVIENGAANPLLVGAGAGDVVLRDNGEFLVSCFQNDVVERRDANGGLMQSYAMGDGPGYMVRLGTTLDSPVRTPPDHRVELISAYPNPFNGELTITFGEQVMNDSKVIICNSLGRIVTELRVPGHAKELRWSPVEFGLSSGNYWINLISGEKGGSYRVSFVK